MLHLISNEKEAPAEQQQQVALGGPGDLLALKIDADLSKLSQHLARITRELGQARPEGAASNLDCSDSSPSTRTSSTSTSAISSSPASLSTSSSSSCIITSTTLSTTTATPTLTVQIRGGLVVGETKEGEEESGETNAQIATTSNAKTAHDHHDELELAEIAELDAAQAAGAPKRSRSLVDDAKLDTQRNRQLLEEIRREQQVRASVDLRDDADADEGALPVGEPADKTAGSGPQSNETKEVAGTLAEAHQEQDEAREAEKLLSDFPRHISDLDHCNHLLIKYEPELDPTHPGFHDLEYRQRRKEVAEVAFNYRHGDRIPEIAYSEKERATWRTIYLRLKEAYAKYACEQHNLVIAQMEAEGVYSSEFIPQLQQVSEFLEKKSGWRLRPVAGLLSARDFLASLAFRVFQTTQYIRHWGNPEHSVEPDCIHELMGHIPMLCDQEFAQFSQELGLASLGASDEQIEKFATLYWFTVEFGLCREKDQLKCYGAGLLSSYGEMEHALESGKPKLKEFVPEETAVETYDDSEYQVVYYVARSFHEAKQKIKQYAQAHLERKFELVYDPYTCSIRELNSYEQLESYTNSIKSDVNRLCAAVGKLKLANRAEASK